MIKYMYVIILSTLHVSLDTNIFVFHDFLFFIEITKWASFNLFGVKFILVDGWTFSIQLNMRQSCIVDG